MKLFCFLSFIILLSSCFTITAQTVNPLVEETVVTTDVNDTTAHTYVAEWPSFPGGNTARNRFLGENLVYPRSAEKQGIEGRVIIAFIIEKNGEITNVEVLKSVDPSLDSEAVRVVKMMPPWIPAKNNGEPVRCKYKVDIVYKLPGRKSSSK